MLYRLCDCTGKVLAENNTFRYLKDAFDKSGVDKAVVYIGTEKDPVFTVTKETTCVEWNRVAREVDDF